jgi:GAF domain-containing protein
VSEPPVPPSVLADLNRIADAIGTATRPASAHALVAEVTATARAVFGAAGCSLALLSEDSSELVFTTVAGTGAETISGMRMPAGQGIAGWVVMTGQPLAVADVRQDARFASDVATSVGFQPTSILACPVATDDSLLGVIEVLDRDPTRAGAEGDLQLLGLFGRQAAYALEAAAQFDRLGRVLLKAAAGAADGDLAEALLAFAAAAPEPDRELAELATAFAALAQQGDSERRLAVEVLRSVAAYAQRSRRWQ